MHRWTVVGLAALLGATLALPAAAQWKWRDKNGQTQYSDLPPPSGIAEQDILARPGSAQRHAPLAAPAPASGASAPLLVPKAVEPELEAKRHKAEQEEAAKKKIEDERLAANRAENCNRAKAQMRTLDSGVRIARSNDKGEREILDDQTRADEGKRARDVAASDCR